MNRKEMLDRQQAIVDAARRENRSLTAEEQEEFDSLTRQLHLEKERDPAENSEGAEPTNEQRTEIITEERQRISEITAMCRELGVSETQMQKFIDNGTNINEVRAQIITSMRQSGSPVPQGNGTVEVTQDEADKYRRAAVDGLLMRGGVISENLADGADGFANMSLRDLAVEILSKETGERNLARKSSDELFTMLCRGFYNPSAAFPSIMDQAINKAYVEGHKTVNVTFDRFTKKGTLTDFKKHDNNYLSGPAGEFLEVPENGELKADIIKDEKRPQRQLKTYGRQFTMTRQAFINDDIGFLSRVPAKYAKSARKTINKQVFKIMMDNPKIYDNKKLFSAEHGNLVTIGTGITAASLRSMIMALNTQTDEFGEAAIIRPSKIVVPAGYMFDMYTIFFSPTINTEENTQAVNPLYNYREQIEVIEDPTINALAGGSGNVMPWWIIGDQDDTDFIEVDYLNGQEVPTIRRSEQPGTLGFIWDVYLDWGISVMDFRGAVMNPGVTVESNL